VSKSMPLFSSSTWNGASVFALSISFVRRTGRASFAMAFASAITSVPYFASNCTQLGAKRQAVPGAHAVQGQRFKARKAAAG
jgi:hypothetical protein